MIRALVPAVAPLVGGRGLALAAAALALGGCITVGVQESELPERPLVLTWYEPEAQRRRVEALAEARERGPEPATPGRAVVEMEAVSDYVSGLLGVPRDDLRSIEKRFPGRLSLLAPRDADVRALEGPRPSALARARSAGGERFILTQALGGGRQLFEMDLERREIRPLTHGPGVHADGCYGPDGRLVLARAEIVQDRAMSFLYLTEPGGGRPRRLSDGPNDYAPACAPDGSAIAWVRNDGRGPDRLVARSPVVEGAERVLGPGRDPAFSPDGEWIAYAARVGDRWQLHRIRADGSGRRRIGRSPMNQIEPTFSPDGRILAYVAEEEGRRLLFVQRFDGSGNRVLLGSGGARSPIW